jgi:hypothetical protein
MSRRTSVIMSSSVPSPQTPDAASSAAAAGMCPVSRTSVTARRNASLAIGQLRMRSMIGGV